MKAVIQRTTQASVSIDENEQAKIAEGLVVFLGVHVEDTPADATYLAQKISNMRIFADAEGKMNQSILTTGGQILSISQFTLYAQTKKGNRPSYTQAARPEIASPLYDLFNDALRATGIDVQTGIFGADMKVALVNDGPVTIVIDTREDSHARK
jgi:D-tyrosyl-tRNA(Tyr) deacylase